MQKSSYVLGLDSVQKATQVFLKPLGFRKKGRTHRRTTSEGLCHVINFQMGEYPIGDHYVIPGIRESYYGLFTVNLGIFLPCVNRAEFQAEAPANIQEYHCPIRERLSSLAYGKDEWFSLSSDTSSISSRIVDLFDRFGLPFFDQFNSYQDVLVYYKKYGDLPFRNQGRAALDVAIVAKEVGDDALAEKLFELAYAWDNPAFKRHVSAIASREGYKIG